MNARLVEISSKGGDNISTTNHASLPKDVRFTLEIRYMEIAKMMKILLYLLMYLHFTRLCHFSTDVRAQEEKVFSYLDIH